MNAASPMIVFRSESESGPTQEAATPELMGERGRGLLIVAALATTWEITYTAGGTVAWFEVKRKC
jgi:hypothetical protein